MIHKCLLCSSENWQITFILMSEHVLVEIWDRYLFFVWLISNYYTRWQHEHRNVTYLVAKILAVISFTINWCYITDILYMTGGGGYLYHTDKLQLCREEREKITVEDRNLGIHSNGPVIEESAQQPRKTRKSTAREVLASGMWN